MIEANERAKIRRLMRERRGGLDHTEMRAAAERLQKHLFALTHVRQARNLAAYIAVQNEISLDPVIHAAWSLNIPVYLPCLRRARMEFRRYEPGTALHMNRFGIPEPELRAESRINVKFLDIVLTPLLAFDTTGGRLGTGGGYYDRTFEFLLDRNYWKRPTLIGVAYEFQQVQSLPLASWDIPLNAVVTEKAAHEFET